MGPRRCRRGRGELQAGRGEDSGLQWGRVVADAEGDWATDPNRRAEALQWGRVVADAEGGRSTEIHTTPSDQLQWGRVVADAEGHYLTFAY